MKWKALVFWANPSLRKVSDLIASAEFCSNLGTIYIEAHKLIDADPALAALSLSELRNKLDDEGFPVDLLIEQFRDLSQFNENVLDTFILQVKSRSYEPEGPQVLADCIENQGQQLSSSIHQLLDQSVQNVISITEVGGGFGKEIENHPFASAYAAIALATAGGGLIAHLRRKAKYNEAVANVERQITNDARRQSEHAADTLRSISRREILWAERSPAQAYKDILKSSEVYKNDSCKINLLNDASEYTEKEIERIIEPFTKAARSRIDRAFSKRSESTQKLLRTDLTREFATANAKREIKELEQQMGGEIPDRKARFQDLYDGEMRRLSLTDAYNKELNTYLARPFKEAFANAKNNRYVLIEGEMQKLDNFIAKKIDIAVKRSEAYAKDRLHKDEKLLQDQVERDAERELEELGDALDPKLIQAEMDAREKARKAVRKSENGAEDAVDDLV